MPGTLDNNLFPNDNVTCISPWYELRINASGSLSYCQQSAIKSELTDLSFVQWFNQGNYISQARSSIKNGKSFAGCEACYQTESKGIVSARNRSNIKGAIYDGQYFKESLHQSQTWPRLINNHLNSKPSFLHVTLSNLCNLSCRMCDPMYSSQLTTTMKRLNLVEESRPTLIEWANDPTQWQNFCDLVFDNSDLMCVHFMGGEPLAHKKFYEFIDLCIEKNQTDFHLTFVTNGTFYNSELTDKLKLFKSVQVEISIENLHPTNDYIRVGSNFTKVKENILKFSQNQTDKLQVVLRTVPQALSIIYYDTLIDFALEHQLNIDSNDLLTRQFLKVFVLPKDIKQQLIDKFQSLYSVTNSNLSVAERSLLMRNKSEVVAQLHQHVLNIIKLLNESEPTNISELRKQFIQYNQKFDSGPDKFLSLYPELEQFYHEYN